MQAASRRSPFPRGQIKAALTGALATLTASIALLPVPFNLAAVVGLGTATLTLLRPIWGLYLVLLSVPMQDIAAPEVGGAAITATKVMVPLALASWVVRRLTRGGWRFAPAALTLPYCLYIAALAISIITALDQFVAIVETLRWLQSFGIFLMVLDLIRTRRELAGMIAILLLGGLSQAVLGLAQSSLGAGPASFIVAAGGSRAFGAFGMPNSYAGYLEMSFPVALALAVWLTGVVLRAHANTPTSAVVLRWLGAGLTTVLLVGGILASFSRGAWVGATAGVAAMVALSGRRAVAIGASAGLLALALLSLGGAALLPADIVDRFDSIGDSLGYRDVRRMVITPENYAVAERLGMWQAGLNMFDDRPLTGVGAGNYDAAYPHYRVPQFIYSRGHAHNYYIHVAAETGIIGLIAYALLLIGAWIDIGRGLLRVRNGWPRAIIIGAAGVLVAVMTHNIGENLHVLNMNLHLFAVLAIPALAIRLIAQEEARP